MSRVKPGQKYLNLSKYNQGLTCATKIQRTVGEKADYTKAKTLSSWLFLKYGISYKQYRNKSATRRSALREEYAADTEADTECPASFATMYLADIGVPLSEFGEILGVGWDD